MSTDALDPEIRRFAFRSAIALGVIVVLAIGGCPGNGGSGDPAGDLGSPDGSNGGTPVGLNNWNGGGSGGGSSSGGNSSGGGGSTAGNPTSGFGADNLSAATFKDRAITMRLRASNASGPVTFTIVGQPTNCTLSSIVTVDENSADVQLLPSPGFEGLAQFNYRAINGGVYSDPGTAVVEIVPEVRFDASPSEGPRNLATTVSAFSPGGAPLPNGSYSWDIDGATDEGPMQTHRQRTLSFGSAGTHEVGLSIIIVGYSNPLPAYFGDVGENLHLHFGVWPQVTGSVRDSNGAAQVGITVAATGAGTGVTDAQGNYSLDVPLNWSGTIAPHAISAQPAGISFSAIGADVSGVNFVVTRPGGSTNWLVSGVVRDASGQAISGATITLSSGPMALTDSAGAYSVSVSSGYTGTITPSKTNYTFSPPNRQVTNVTADTSGQDFTGTVAGSANQPPTANGQSVSTNEDTNLSITLSGSDPEGAGLRYVVTSLPTRGALRDASNSATIQASQLPYMLISSGRVVQYVPNSNVNGADSFAFKTDDGALQSAAATVNVNVISVNDPPAIAQGTLVNLSVSQNSLSTSPANRKNLSATDPDAAANSLVWTISSAASHGTASVASGSPSSSGATVVVAYQPTSGYLGSDAFTVQVRDAGNAADTIIVSVAVGGNPISGVVTDHAGSPRQGIELEARDGSNNLTASATTDASGFYSLIVPTNWSGTVSSSANARLIPPSNSYGNVTAAIGGEDYQGFRNFYVAPGGSTSGSGAISAPYGTIQSAANATLPGDTVLIRAGTYTTGSPSANATVLAINGGGGAPGYPLTIKAYPGESVIISGVTGTTRELFTLDLSSYVDIEDLEFTEAQRTAIAISDINTNGACDTHDVNVRRCVAHHNNYDVNFIGGAFRTEGTVQYVVFEDCLAYKNSNGFEFREYPTQTSTTCSVPPQVGNILGYTADLPESQWTAWAGWTTIAARYCTVRRCIAYDNDVRPESSNGIQPRYAIECLFEDNIAFRNADDNIDGVGSTRCTYRRNIAFDANPNHTAQGDGNGIKIGVRGGLDNTVYGNISFDNPRAGFDMADSERSLFYNNTVLNAGWFGVWFEAVRATTGGQTVYNNVVKNGGRQGDIGHNGAATRVIAFDYNSVADANNHNWALPPGSHGRINTDPLFTNEALTVDVNFPPSATTVAAKHAYIKNQVLSKLGLAANSPLIDQALPLAGVNDVFLGAGPDTGAIESH
ncbi:MAG: Ig-like domain-containing protein [Phycisphaerae bacterium]